MYCVYNHKRLDTGKVFYVGIGDSSRPYSKINRNQYWHNIVNKCGYEVEVTHKDLYWPEACGIERYLIAFYGRKDLGEGDLVNLTDGGEGAVGLIHNEESRSKMSSAKKILLADKTNHPLYGLRGPDSPNYGRKRSAKAKENLSKAKIGAANPMYGRTGEKCPNSKKVLDTDTNKVYESVTAAAIALGVNRKVLNRKLLGGRNNNTSLIFLNQITHDEKDISLQ